ncbi:MAG TPA: zinc-finger domain-containing protein [Steroidobacteraceae bacterium]|nr:zinc-finger domain-containing protein [Steroidobacteraceae bacterium]
MSAIVADELEHRLIQANAEHRYTVTAADLPLSCPMPGMVLWNSHPCVYLPIEPTGWAKCAYCGAEYTLRGTLP